MKLKTNVPEFFTTTELKSSQYYNILCFFVTRLAFSIIGKHISKYRLHES